MEASKLKVILIAKSAVQFWNQLNQISINIFLLSHTGRAAKLQNLDEDMINEIVGDDGQDDKAADAKKQTSKAKAQVERRLAAERKKAAKSNGGKKTDKDDDDDDEDDFAAFAKGSREKQKKR